MTLQGGAVAIVPRPARMEVGPGAFVIAPATAILVKSHDADVTDVGDCLAKWLRDATGYALPVRALSEGESLDGSIVLATTDDLAGQAAYQLVVEPRRVSLSAPQAGGLFHGVQTIRQLMSPNGGDGGRLPCLRISDSPRYRWRGMLLDCCRH